MIYKTIIAVAYLIALANAAAYNFKIRPANDDVDTAELATGKRQEVLVKNPIIFGLDMLGWGVDLRTSPPDEGSLKVPMYTWAYTQGNSYLYPLEPETRFQVPDEVYVRTVATMKGTNRIYTKTDEYLTDLHIGLGLSIKQAAQNANTNSNNNAATGANSSTSLSQTDLSGFSGSVGVTYNKRQLNTDGYLLVQNSLMSALYQLVVGPDISIRQSVQNAQQLIRDTSDASEKYLMQAEWVDRYGTHFIDSVIVGGNLVTESITQTSTSLSLQEISLMANFGFSNMFGLSSGDLSLNLSFVDSYKSFQQDTTNNIDVQGGDPELANFFRGDVEPSETFVNWAQTLIRNPAAINTRCREISWLWNTDEVQDFSQIVTDYLNGQTPF